MRRMLLVCAVALVMAAMMGASAMPAFAKFQCSEGPDLFDYTCHGGDSWSEPGGINNGLVGGFGNHQNRDCNPELTSCRSDNSGGGGTVALGGAHGGSGFHCDPEECVGKGFNKGLKGGPA